MVTWLRAAIGTRLAFAVVLLAGVVLGALAQGVRQDTVAEEMARGWRLAEGRADTCEQRLTEERQRADAAEMLERRP